LKPPDRPVIGQPLWRRPSATLAARFAGSSPAGFSGWQSKGGQGRPVYRCLRLEREIPIRTPGKM
jgi:hypothetical protein